MPPRIERLVARMRALVEGARQRFSNYLFPPASRQSEEGREDADFMPDRLAALFQQPPRPAFLIIRASLLVLAVALVWAALGSLDEIAIGEGKVIPSSQVQVIQNLEGGIVANIPVRVGDLVRKDQVVIQLDEKRFASSMGEAKAKNNALMAKVARLTAETNGVVFSPPADLMKEEPKIAEDELHLFQNRQHELDAALSVLRQQVNQRSQEISEKRAKLNQLQESYNLISQELKMSKPLLAQGVMSEVEILRIERSVAETRGDLEGTRLAIPRLEAQLSEARSKLEGALAKFRRRQ